MKFSQYLKCMQELKCCKTTKTSNKGEFVTLLDKSFPKAYKPSAVEENVYGFWESNGFFTKRTSKADKFSLVLPPPNVTGTLHLGHALTVAIQDTLVRWHRMQGRDVVWVPGLDHAGIATQTVVEKWLKQNRGVSRHDIGRKQFLQEVMNWKQEKGDVINQQLRRMGASLDWTREMFTMDPRHNEAVIEAVTRLWQAGLLYRREALVNWSCQLRSAISDIEVERVDVTGPTPLSVPGYDKPVMFGELTDFAYKVCGSDEELVVSTTRLETMLGDVAVAVHPTDSRFTHLHNAQLWHPFRNSAIPVLCDTMVDPQFGSGAVKITPGHSHADWEVSQRHDLPLLSVIDESGCISANINKFQGMKRFDARQAIKNELAALSLLRTTRPHAMQVPMCSRSGDVVEYLQRDQWFISCKGMAEKASAAVREGRLIIEPASFVNVWFEWLDNIRDWCISRQLWWGHQLPLYLATKDAMSLWVAAPSLSHATTLATSHFQGQPDSVVQDPDVLDTWFSSALYPMSALGWPKQTDELKRYFPLNLMETGHDILFFWVARMVMLSLELTEQLPFKKISLHGIVCDAQGRKMSKSLGNVILPEDVIYGISLEGLKQKMKDSHKAGVLSAKEAKLAAQGQEKLFPEGIPECGTDALRFTLLSHNTKSNFVSFDVRECEVNHHFCNKIWQASRYTLGRLEQLGLNVGECGPPAAPALMDRWVLACLHRAALTVSAALESADFCQATAALKHFLYYQFCDVYVEITKPVLRDSDREVTVNTCQTLLYCLDVSIRLSAPIMPFICEQLFRHLPGNQDKSAMVAQYPSLSDLQTWEDTELCATVQTGLDLSSAIRSLKSVHGFYKKHIPVEVETTRIEAVMKMKEVIELLANCALDVSERSDERRKQTLTEILGDHSLVHISLKNISEEQYESYVQNLVRKEAKLQKTLNKLVEGTSKKSYKKVDEEVKLRHAEQIKQMQEELKTVRSYMERSKTESSGQVANL